MSSSKFALQLNKEIEKKRKQLEQVGIEPAAKTSDSQTEPPSKKKWIKRSELYASTAAVVPFKPVLARQGKAPAKDPTGDFPGQQHAQGQKDHVVSSDGNDKRRSADPGAGLSMLPIVKNEAQDSTGQSMSIPPVDVVVRKLRALNEPVTLPGETQKDRYLRLRKIQLKRETESTSITADQRNVLLMKLKELEGNKAHSVADVDIWDEERDSVDEKVPGIPSSAVGAGSVSEPPSNSNVGSSSAAHDTKEQFILSHISKVLVLWEKELVALQRTPEGTKAKGRVALATFEQTREYLRPLQKMLSEGRVSSEILESLNKIFKFVDEREYVKANDVYLRLAIGNAPWPMGATAVGIHARTAREKIGEEHIAHIMNDEQTRKFIQAVKRLITKAQSYFPNVPSKMISS